MSGITHTTPSDGTFSAAGAAAWDETHTVADNTLVAAKLSATATDKIFGRSTAGAGAGEEIACTSAARTVLDDATVAAMVDTLGGASSTGSGGLVRASGPTIAGHATIEGVTATGATGTGKLVFDTSPQISTIELGAASDTTLSRAAAGVLAVEGIIVATVSNIQNFITGCLITKNDATHIDISAGVFYDPSSSKIISYAGGTAISAGTLNTASNQWNQVYGYDNSGTTTIEIVNNAAPPATTYAGTARQGGTNSNRRWLGCFLSNANAAGSIVVAQNIKETAPGQLLLSYLDTTTNAPFRVLSAKTETSFTAQTLIGCVPRYVAVEILSTLWAGLVTTAANDHLVITSLDGTNAGASMRSYVATTSSFAAIAIWCGIESSTPQVWYRNAVQGSGAGPVMYMDVLSFRLVR